MNKVILIGRLTKDPDLKFAPGSGSAVVNFTLAVPNYNSKTGEKGADFIPVIAWGKMAENVANYLSKGSQAGVTGRLQTRTYDAKDGTKKYITEVIADLGGIEFLGEKGNGASGNNSKGNNNTYAPNTDPFGGGSFDDDITPVDDGDMPF